MDAKRFAKTLALALARGSVLPLVALYRAERALTPGDGLRVFAAWSQAVSLVPGQAGDWLRRAFYMATLPEVHPASLIEWGTVFSKDDVRIAEGVYLGARCMIGRCHFARHATVASNVDILSGKRQHGTDDPDVPVQDQPGQYDLVRVGENAWIGNGAIVMADVGARSVVAAGSVVTQPVPDDCVVGGNPARVLKVRDPVTKQWVKPS